MYVFIVSFLFPCERDVRPPRNQNTVVCDVDSVSRQLHLITCPLYPRSFSRSVSEYLSDVSGARVVCGCILAV